MHLLHQFRAQLSFVDLTRNDPAEERAQIYRTMLSPHIDDGISYSLYLVSVLYHQSATGK